jgi:hypothetical protein
MAMEAKYQGICTTGTTGDTLVDENAQFVDDGTADEDFAVDNCTQAYQSTIKTVSNNTTLILNHSGRFAVGDYYTIWIVKSNQHCRFINNYVADSWGEGLDVNKMNWNQIVRGNTVIDCDTQAIDCSGAPSTIVEKNIIVHETGPTTSTGIESPWNGVVQNNIVNNVQTGIRSDSDYKQNHTDFKSNLIINTTGFGIFSNYSDLVSIKHNVIYDTTYSGIASTGSLYNNIIGNVALDCGRSQTADNAIQISASAADNTFASNVIYDRAGTVPYQSALTATASANQKYIEIGGSGSTQELYKWYVGQAIVLTSASGTENHVINEIDYRNFRLKTTADLTYSHSVLGNAVIKQAKVADHAIESADVRTYHRRNIVRGFTDSANPMFTGQSTTPLADYYANSHIIDLTTSATQIEPVFYAHQEMLLIAYAIIVTSYVNSTDAEIQVGLFSNGSTDADYYDAYVVNILGGVGTVWFVPYSNFDLSGGSIKIPAGSMVTVGKNAEDEVLGSCKVALHIIRSAS